MAQVVCKIQLDVNHDCGKIGYEELKKQENDKYQHENRRSA